MSILTYLRHVMPGFLVASSLGAAHQAEAHPIDCAILLCLAGGFPASPECAAAKAEMIRRVTPWPIEPPLQIWNCPLGGGDGTGLPSEFGAYRDSIQLWRVSKSWINSSGGRDLYLSVSRQSYDDAGRFRGYAVPVAEVPDWVRAQVRDHAGTALADEYGSFRAILLRTLDHQGDPSYHWIAY